MYVQKAVIEGGEIKYNKLGKVGRDELEAGIADAYFTHEQIEPAATWFIEHFLNKNPSVAVVDSAGTEFQGVVSYINENALRIDFNAQFAGKAYLN